MKSQVKLEWPPPTLCVDGQQLRVTVVPDWRKRVKQAEKLCRIIDQHLDYEARERCLLDTRAFTVRDLFPEQRIHMITDVYALRRRDVGDIGDGASEKLPSTCLDDRSSATRRSKKRS